MTTMVSGIIAVARASGWLLAYLQFNDQALAFVTSVSKDPTVMWWASPCKARRHGGVHRARRFDSPCPCVRERARAYHCAAFWSTLRNSRRK